MMNKNQEEIIDTLTNYFNTESHNLVSSVAHDVKNPLGIIDLSLGLLEDRVEKLLENEDQKTKAKIMKFIDNISVGLEKCEQILDNVLLLRRMDADYEVKRDFGISQLITNHHIFSKPALKTKTVSFEVSIGDDQMVNVNEKAFTMVLNGAIRSIVDHLATDTGAYATAYYENKQIKIVLVSKKEENSITLKSDLSTEESFREKVFQNELEKTGYKFTLNQCEKSVEAIISIP